MYEALMNKSVKIRLTTPVKTHFSKATKTIYGTLISESGMFITAKIGFVTESDVIYVQQHLIDKSLVKSIEKAWLETVIKGKIEYFKSTEVYIPARDGME